MRISDWSSDVCSSDLPDRANKVDVLRRAGGHDAGATRLGELDGEMADPARRAMNQDVLPFGQAAMIEQGLPCRQAGQRDGGRVDQTDPTGSRGAVRGSDRCQLREAAAPHRPHGLAPTPAPNTPSPA